MDARADIDSYEDAFLNTLDRWLAREVAPHVKRWDHEDVYPHELIPQMRELGLFGLTISEQYGGSGMAVSTYVRVVERVCRTWMSLSGIFNTHLIMARCIEAFGTPAQKALWLPKLASGELRGGLGLTEPDAGSDLQGIRTVALREGDHYIVNGAKTWITNSLEGDCIALLVKTDPGADPPRAGMSLLIACKDHPGFEVVGKLKKLGYRGVDTAQLAFTDYAVPADRLIGGVEGRGFHQAVAGLELGRINVAARAVGVARAALEDSVAYAQVRRTMGKSIAEHQAIQILLADMATRTEAARLLVAQAADAFDAGRRADMEAGMAKLFASETARQNAMDAMRIHGGYGYSAEYDIERYYRDAPLMIIGEGTNEIQKLVIARQLIARSKA